MITTDSAKKMVLVLFGGESPEHEVSIISAQNVYNAMNLNKIEPILCYIDRQGNWLHAPSIIEHDSAKVPITPLLGAAAVKIGDKQVRIDTIFPVLHGTHGEDGTVQGLARLMHVPIVGCGLVGSALCIDKILTKQLLTLHDIPVTPSVVHYAGEKLPDFAELQRTLGEVLFVKPARQGSSVGVSMVRTGKEFIAALKTALRYDREILIETAILGARELEIAVLGSNTRPRASVVGEIVPDREFYSYESKYDAASTSQIVIPAKIDENLAALAQDLARKAFRALQCTGLARVDFLLATDGSIYLNEINTMPGFTNISMYPQLWAANGLSYPDLVATLIDSAE